MTHALFAIPWHDLFLPKPSWAEKILRPCLVYLVLLVLFRVASKRELAQATLFDFLIVLLISNVVQNAMIGDDNSVLGGAAGAVTLLALSAIFNRIASRSKRARVVLEGTPMLLIREGKIDDAAMDRESVTRNDLLSAIRKQGISRLADVAFAILELDGTISVIRRDEDRRPHDALPAEIAGSESAEEHGARAA